MSIESYKELIVWQKSIELVKELYKATEKLPPLELYGLSSQMRRAAVSIPSNIAEGYQRRNRKEYLQFLGIAGASAAELETQIIITNSIYPKINFDEIADILSEIQRMLTTMLKKLNIS